MKKFNVGDEVYFTNKSYYGNFIANNKLSQLHPKKGIIYGVKSNTGIFGSDLYSYEIKCDKYYLETYSNIHTCFSSLDDYFTRITEQIINFKMINKTVVGKLKNAISGLFN